MPLFISYSQQDKAFVDELAFALVKARARVWLDRWELNVGDSLTQRIMAALAEADALLVVLSPASVSSEWCKRELSAGLIRELEEKKVLVLPLLLQDCDVPLFLKDKLRADFRKDFDEGLEAVLRAVSRITNTTRSRIETPDWHNDWAIDHGLDNQGIRIVLTFIESAPKHPYTVQIVITAFGDDVATNNYMAYYGLGLADFYVDLVVGSVADTLISNDLRQVLGTKNPEVVPFPAFDECPTAGLFSVRMESRLLGSDTGSDALIDIANLLREAQDHLHRGRRPLTAEENAAIAKALDEIDV